MKNMAAIGFGFAIVLTIIVVAWLAAPPTMPTPQKVEQVISDDRISR